MPQSLKKNKKIIKRLNHPDPAERRRIIEKIREDRLQEYSSDLVRIMKKDPDYDTRLVAIRALKMIADIQTGPALLNLLDTNDIPVLLEIIPALGRLCSHGYTEALPPLEALLNHTNFRVKKFTIEALGECGSSSTIEKLFAIFEQKDSSIQTKQMVATAIGKIGGSRSIQILINLIIPNERINALEMEVRRAAIIALGESQNPAALQILGKIYNDKAENKIIRNYAQQAIRKVVEGAKEHYLMIKRRAKRVMKGKN